MAHVKVWLSLLLTLALAALLWVIPHKLNQTLRSQRPQLVPLQQHTAFQQKIGRFLKKAEDTIQQLATHKGVREALDELAKVKRDRRNKRHKKAYEAINTSFPFYRGSQQNKRLLIFAKDEQLVFRSDKPGSYPSETHPYQHLPFATRALQGKTKSGFWRIGPKVYFLVGTPIRQSSIIGALLMVMEVDRSFFVEMSINPDDQKQGPIVLLDRDKPLAYAVPKPMINGIRTWLTGEYVQLANRMRRGVYIPKKAVKIKGESYGYVLSPFPVSMQDGLVGTIQLTKIPPPKGNDLYEGDLSQLIAAGVGGFAILLALWFSIGLMMKRRKLIVAVKDVAGNPHQPKLLETIPSTYKKLREPLKGLLELATKPPPQPAAPIAPKPEPKPAPEPKPEPQPLLLPADGPLIPSPIATPPPASELPPLQPALAPLAPLGAPAPTPAPTPTPTPTPAPAPDTAGESYQAAPPPGALKEAQGVPPEALPTLAPQTPAPQEHTPDKPPKSGDLADELEMAFAGIQDEPAGSEEGGETNRQTLLYEQFDQANLAQATENLKKEKLQNVFQAYIDLRDKCGESTSNIEFDAFVERLNKQRDHIIKQFSCTDVQFHVYEKGGKAAIKATPVK